MTHPHRKRSAITAGLLCAIATITVAMPSSAMAASAIAASAMASEASADDLQPRVERACLRIPNLETRTSNLIVRLQDDAAVRGSLAWLQVQIDQAESRGRTDVVEVLENRLAVRSQTLVVLEQRRTELATLRSWCVDHGVAL